MGQSSQMGGGGMLGSFNRGQTGIGGLQQGTNDALNQFYGGNMGIAQLQQAVMGNQQPQMYAGNRVMPGYGAGAWSNALAPRMAQPWNMAQSQQPSLFGSGLSNALAAKGMPDQNQPATPMQRGGGGMGGNK